MVHYRTNLFICSGRGLSSCATAISCPRGAMPCRVVLPCHYPTWPSLPLYQSRHRNTPCGYRRRRMMLSTFAHTTRCNTCIRLGAWRFQCPARGAPIYLASMARPLLSPCIDGDEARGLRWFLEDNSRVPLVLGKEIRVLEIGARLQCRFDRRRY